MYFKSLFGLFVILYVVTLKVTSSAVETYSPRIVYDKQILLRNVLVLFGDFKHSFNARVWN